MRKEVSWSTEVRKFVTSPALCVRVRTGLTLVLSARTRKSVSLVSFVLYP